MLIADARKVRKLRLVQLHWIISHHSITQDLIVIFDNIPKNKIVFQELKPIICWQAAVAIPVLSENNYCLITYVDNTISLK